MAFVVSLHFVSYNRDAFKRLVNIFQLSITCRLYVSKALDIHRDFTIVTATHVIGMLSIQIDLI